MFVSQTHLPQLLAEAHYVDRAFHEREIDALFMPGWHCVGVADQFPREGDYRTTELFGRPLLCWRVENRFRVFLNVCAHRFCTLTDRPCGRAAGHIKCQYHGWEYDETGNTCRIPDAQSFRPLKKGELGLKEYRTETVGQLIFMTFSDAAPSLAEFLGPELMEICQTWFSPDHRITLVNDLALRCNWKIAIENVLESYHIACVHPQTFTQFPDQARCTHDFHATYDHYIDDYRNHPSSARGERFIQALIGAPTEYRWHHILRYPNVVLGGATPWHYIQMIWPVAPDASRSLTFLMHYSGPKGSAWAFLLHRALKRLGAAFSRRVQQEDADIYPSVHRGTVAPDRPYGGGLISAREERIFAFQEYLLRSTGSPLPPTARPFTAASASAPATADADLTAARSALE